MIEDKLTHDERLRLESIAQAINFVRGNTSTEGLVHVADQIAKYVKEGK